MKVVAAATPTRERCYKICGGINRRQLLSLHEMRQGGAFAHGKVILCGFRAFSFGKPRV